MPSEFEKLVNDYDSVEDIFDDLKKREKRKRAVNSSRKGKDGERKICKYLSEKFNLPFSRVPQSGAFGTTHNLSDEAKNVLSGDIICPTNFAWSLEQKTGYDIDLNNMFCLDNAFFKGKESDKKKVFDFIDQACRDAHRVKRLPMVIYIKDRRVPLSIIPLVNHDKQSFLIELDSSIKMEFVYKPKKYELWDKWGIFALEELIEKLPSEFWFK